MTDTSEQVGTAFEVVKDEFIAAPIDVVFETVLEQMGPLNQKHDGVPMPMVIEAWPGGRWYRDLGNNTGHLWGHVQSIKPPTLLEFYGPLMMSAAAMSNVQYRLTPEGRGTRLQFWHRAFGNIPPDLRDGKNVNRGWSSIISRIRDKSEQKEKK